MSSAEEQFQRAAATLFAKLAVGTQGDAAHEQQIIKGEDPKEIARIPVHKTSRAEKSCDEQKRNPWRQRSTPIAAKQPQEGINGSQTLSPGFSISRRSI